MNPAKLPVHQSFRTGNSTVLWKTSLLIVLLLSACNPAAAPATSVPVDVPTLETLQPFPETVSMPEGQSFYPYYLPLATKPDIAPQTINGVTTTIDWVYVDESRIALQYTISGLDWPDGTPSDPMKQVRIKSAALPNSSYSGAGSWNGGYVMNGKIVGMSDLMFREGGLDAGIHPTIDLTVDIPVEGPTQVGTFHFDLNAPVGDGRKIENIDQTVEANDVAMTLKTLLLTPSHVEALLCFEMPSEMDWGLAASTVTVGGKDYRFSGGGLIAGADGKGFSLSDPERCSNIGFDIAYEEPLDSITLTVPRLMASTPEVITQDRVDRANQRLAYAGIEFEYVNVDHGGNIVLKKQPEGKSEAEIYPMIWDALADQYEGPWLFTVPILP